MAKLPQFPTADGELQLLQNRWAQIIDPVIALPQNSSVLLQNIILSSSSVINHSLGRNLQGWQIVRQRGNADIYDTQDVNSIPDKTLQLVSSSGISVDLICF